tara:strand:+ start:55 stop:201 length:147 start_codon:yes stop_codon:yes gene_type:complete
MINMPDKTLSNHPMVQDKYDDALAKEYKRFNQLKKDYPNYREIDDTKL